VGKVLQLFKRAEQAPKKQDETAVRRVPATPVQADDCDRGAGGIGDL
jgi:hypothetical protein